MSEAKHMPGPWSRYNDGPCPNIFIESTKGGSVCKIANNSYAEANAHLIAAAPELLEALEAVIDYAPHEEFPFTAQVKAAIRKAKGE